MEQVRVHGSLWVCSKRGNGHPPAQVHYSWKLRAILLHCVMKVFELSSQEHKLVPVISPTRRNDAWRYYLPVRQGKPRMSCVQRQGEWMKVYSKANSFFVGMHDVCCKIVPAQAISKSLFLLHAGVREMR